MHPVAEHREPALLQRGGGQAQGRPLGDEGHGVGLGLHHHREVRRGGEHGLEERLRLPRLASRGGQLGHVGHRHHRADHRAVVVAQGASVAAHQPRSRALAGDHELHPADRTLGQRADERDLRRRQQRHAVRAVQVEARGPVVGGQRGVRGQPVPAPRRRVEQGQPAVGVAGHDAHVDGVEQGGRETRVRRELALHGLPTDDLGPLLDRDPAQQQRGEHLPGQHPQVVLLLLRQPAHLGPDHAERAEHVAVRGPEREARVGDDVGRPGDQGVVREPGVLAGVGDVELGVVADDVVAERHVARGGADVQAHPGLEPLPVLVEQAHQRDRASGDPRGQSHQVVENRLGLGVEHREGLERGETGSVGEGHQDPSDGPDMS